MLRVGVVGTAHVHAPSFVDCFLKHPDVSVVGCFDHDRARGSSFATARSLAFFDTLSDLLATADAVVICSENTRHELELRAAVEAGLHVLCEKPIAVTDDMAAKIKEVASGSNKVLMTAFPCPFSPAFQETLRRVKSGDIGDVLAVSATNQGTCPFGWFVEQEWSGGGAMMDHTVHVADLLYRLIGEPVTARATAGNGMQGLSVDDSAIVTVGFEGGIFATIDCSWSKVGYKTWGNVTLKIVGTKGIAEVDLFNQGVEVYTTAHTSHGVGSSLDAAMVGEFVSAITESRESSCSLADGLRASRVALAAYKSLEKAPVLV